MEIYFSHKHKAQIYELGKQNSIILESSSVVILVEMQSVFVSISEIVSVTKCGLCSHICDCICVCGSELHRKLICGSAYTAA